MFIYLFSLLMYCVFLCIDSKRITQQRRANSQLSNTSSAAISTEVKLKEELECVTVDGFSLFILNNAGRKELDKFRHHVMIELSELKIVNIDNVLQSLFEQEYEMKVESQQPDDGDVCKQLATLSETDVQKKYLNPFLNKYDGLDTSTANRGVPYYILNGQKLGTDGAKPDGMSTCGPLCIEIKKGSPSKKIIDDDKGVIRQGINRVRLQMMMHAFLRVSVCICLTQSHAHVVWALRLKYHKQEMYFARIDLSKWAVLWRSINEVFKSKYDSFIMPDGAALMYAMQGMGWDPWRRRSRWLKHSMSNVYAVYPLNKGKGVNKFEHVIKVIINSDYSEAVVWENLLPSLKAAYGNPFFAIRGWKSNKQVYSDGDVEVNYDDVKGNNDDKSYYWHTSKYKTVIENISKDCEMLVMHRGEHVEEGNVDVFEDVRKCLVAIHNNGWMHMDVRLPNVLKFGDTYQLIDFGFTQKIEKDKVTETTLSSGRLEVAKNAGIVLQDHNEDDLVPWSPDKDIWMALAGVRGLEFY